MTTLHRFGIVLLLVFGKPGWIVAQEQVPPNEVERRAREWEKLVGGPGDRHSEEDPEFRAFLEDISDDTPDELIAKLQQIEDQEPFVSNRLFARYTLSSLSKDHTPRVTLVLLDWLEFRAQTGPVKNFLSVSDTDLYPAMGVLTKRGAEIVPQLLEHAVAGPRSDSYAYRARSLFQAVMPDEAQRKKAIDYFAAEHPEKKAALSIFTPPIEVRARNYEEFKKQLEAAAKPPNGRDGDIYVSVGQWKRMTIDAKPAPVPPK